ncbi:hypothetical protein [Sorangium sp. So ce1024]|uniref:hypothetical protein n=1 Tax=Sorangium sp. So ce1024 TaxID=3133327 RepID=UPI003F00595F
MTSPALSLAEIDASWDADEPSGVRARPQARPAGPPPLQLAVVARRYLEALDAAARARAELADRMGPGDRIEVGDRVVVFVAARMRGDEVVGSSGVRVERRRA